MAFYDNAQLSKIEKAQQDKEWFTAIVLSATQLERHGYLLLREYFDSLNVNSELLDAVFRRIHLIQIAEYLEKISKITPDDYSSIERINSERNKFIHRRETEAFKRGKEADREYDLLVNEAIRILKTKFNVIRLFVGR